ncbi:MAG: hypothetical protein M9950_12875 [Thermomicrobiales bacterium]|nr:hypothetical protein [Thermomicrobiales bacterium]
MAIATVTIDGDTLVVSPKGVNKLWGFRGSIRVPLHHVVHADTGTASLTRSRGMRLPGLGWVNRWVGQYRRKGHWDYWCAVSGPTLEIKLRDEHFTHLILSVDHPKETAWEINERIKG